MATNVKPGAETGSPVPAPGTVSAFASVMTEVDGLAKALAGVPGVVELTPKERHGHAKMPASGLKVVPSIIQMLAAHPELGLGVTDATSMGAKFAFVLDGLNARAALAKQNRKLEDTVLVAAGELWQEMLRVYGVAQQKLPIESGLAAEIAPMAALVSKPAKKHAKVAKAAKRASKAAAGALEAKPETAPPPVNSGSAEPAPVAPAASPVPEPKK